MSKRAGEGGGKVSTIAKKVEKASKKGKEPKKKETTRATEIKESIDFLQDYSTKMYKLKIDAENLKSQFDNGNFLHSFDAVHERISWLSKHVATIMSITGLKVPPTEEDDVSKVEEFTGKQCVSLPSPKQTMEGMISSLQYWLSRGYGGRVPLPFTLDAFLKAMSFGDGYKLIIKKSDIKDKVVVFSFIHTEPDGFEQNRMPALVKMWNDEGWTSSMISPNQVLRNEAGDEVHVVFLVWTSYLDYLEQKLKGLSSSNNSNNNGGIDGEKISQEINDANAFDGEVTESSNKQKSIQSAVLEETRLRVCRQAGAHTTSHQMRPDSSYISLPTLCINARSRILEFLSPRDLGRISIISKSGLNDIADEDPMSLTERVAKDMIKRYPSLILSAIWEHETSALHVYNRVMEGPHTHLTLPQIVGTGLTHPDEDNLSCVSCDGYRSGGAAMSTHVMSCGKHFASFKVNGQTHDSGALTEVGVMRPISDTAWLHISPPGIRFNHKSPQIRPLLNGERTNHWRGNVDICYLECLPGRCCWGDWATHINTYNIENAVHVPHPADFIGLLLDLDKGTLTFYSRECNNMNWNFRGVLKNGLVGEYVWVVLARGLWNDGDPTWCEKVEHSVQCAEYCQNRSVIDYTHE